MITTFIIAIYIYESQATSLLVHFLAGKCQRKFIIDGAFKGLSDDMPSEWRSNSPKICGKPWKSVGFCAPESDLGMNKWPSKQYEYVPRLSSAQGRRNAEFWAVIEPYPTVSWQVFSLFLGIFWEMMMYLFMMFLFFFSMMLLWCSNDVLTVSKFLRDIQIHGGFLSHRGTPSHPNFHGNFPNKNHSFLGLSYGFPMVFLWFGGAPVLNV